MNKKYVIVDIDGTISKVGDRIKYLHQDPKDWDSFYNDCFEDQPINKIINLVEILSENFNIIFCTGRRETVRELTNKWIQLAFKFPIKNEYRLLMRKENDLRHDIIVKPELLDNDGFDLTDIEFILEDRNSMVVEWRNLGFTCLQVAEGNF